MCRSEMPRVCELRDLIDDPSSPSAYFQNFDASLCDPIIGPYKKPVWLAREREFQRLDAESWRRLKDEAHQYLSARDRTGREWEQLISILNQARAHNYLEDKGYSKVCFIQREKKKGKKTPDLKAELDGQTVLCEVKTINPSQAEIDRRQSGDAGSSTDVIDSGFLLKLDNVLQEAKRQIDSYDNSDNVKRIAFVVVNFDEGRSGEYKDCYYAKIDRHLAAGSVTGLEIVFYNQRSPFHPDISMLHAHIVNEAS